MRFIKNIHLSGLTKLHYISFILIVGIVAVQFGIPSGKIAGRVYLGDNKVGGQTPDALEQKLHSHSKAVKLQHGDKVLTYTPEKTGIEFDVQATVDQLPTVSNTDRLIPFKPLYKSLKTETFEPVVKRDPNVIKAFAADLAKSLNTDPVDARAEIKDGKLGIIKDRAGMTFDAKAVEQSMARDKLLPDNPIKLSPVTRQAKVRQKDLMPLQAEFEKRSAKPLKVTFGGLEKTVGPDTLKTWLAIHIDPDSGKNTIVYDPAAAGTTVQAWAKEFNIAPGITQVSYLDDQETSRKTGASGRALDVAAINEQIRGWLDEPNEQPVALRSVALAPTDVATRTYSRSSAQLQAKIDGWIASHNGRYQVAVRELGGRGREASHNVTAQTVMASTYKTFLAFAAYQKAETGALNLGTVISGGRNIEQCIDIMIVRSDNDCAVALGKYIGWAEVDRVIAAAGFVGVKLNNYDSAGNLSGDKLVNAREQAKFLAQLSAGSLINGNNTAKLLNYMKLQMYRDGIPAGSRGAVVANKVGFLDNYLHDVAIVSGRSSTYALVIMSEGSSWGHINDLAQAIYDFMNE